jgi:hypothetical protein
VSAREEISDAIILAIEDADPSVAFDAIADVLLWLICTKQRDRRSAERQVQMFVGDLPKNFDQVWDSYRAEIAACHECKGSA